MTRHIRSSDSIIHGLTNRSGQLCEHRAPTILYMMHLCVQLSFNVVCQVYSMSMPGFSQLATVRGSEPVIVKWKRSQYLTHCFSNGFQTRN